MVAELDNTCFRSKLFCNLDTFHDLENICMILEEKGHLDEQIIALGCIDIFESKLQY